MNTVGWQKVPSPILMPDWQPDYERNTNYKAVILLGFHLMGVHKKKYKQNLNIDT